MATRDIDYEGTTAKGAIHALHEHGVVDEETASTLVTAVGFRNVLAHEYGHIDPAKVYETLQSGLTVYDTYSRQIAQWVRSDT